MEFIEIYADGGCRGNGATNNIGGYGIVLKYGQSTKTTKKAFLNTSNNKMELQSCIEGLKALRKFDIPVIIYSDSAYVCNAFNQNWINNWIRNNWKKSDGEQVKNVSQWTELIELVGKFKNVKFIKVKGHTNNEGNILADKLANEAMDEF